MQEMDEGLPFKKKILVYSLNALMVLLCLFLAYRILAPGYERKEKTSINKLGIFHTQLAAERLGARLGNLREEMKDNGMRLVDSTRGPVALDPSRWLWLRIQDRDWRAPNFLDPLPPPQNDVDSWALSGTKNFFVLTERVPILKEGVRDFVLVEGGFKPVVFQDLQSDPNFGLWIFDLEAYKKGGLGVSKLYEKMSSSGALAKDDLKLLTSDLLGQIFQGQEETVIGGDAPWALFFKNASGPSRLGVLGYWMPQSAPLNLTGVWGSLGVALLVLSLLTSFLILKFSKASPNDELEVPSPTVAKSVLNSAAPMRAGSSAISDEGRITLPDSALSYEGVLAWLHKIIDQLKDPLGNMQDRIEIALTEFSKNIAKIDEPLFQLVNKNLTIARQEALKSRSMIDQISSLSGKSESSFESVDIELFYREFAHVHEEAKTVDTFFDPDLWRVQTDSYDLTLLFRIYIQFLKKRETSDSKLHLSARFMAKDVDDAGAMEVKKSSKFKSPFVRIKFHLPTKTPLGRAEPQEFFELTNPRGGTATSIELPLSLKVVDRLWGRLKIKSNVEDGNVLTLDIPAYEARKPEDKINAKQLEVEATALTEIGYISKSKRSIDPNKEPEVVKEEPKAPVYIPPEVKLEALPIAENEKESHPQIIEEEQEGTKTVLQSEASSEVPPEKSFKTESTDSGMKILRLAEIEKAKSFADNISDERSRVRSRFRIRKPGEKE